LFSPLCPSGFFLEQIHDEVEGELREAFWLGWLWQNDWLFGQLSHEYRETR